MSEADARPRSLGPEYAERLPGDHRHRRAHRRGGRVETVRKERALIKLKDST